MTVCRLFNNAQLLPRSPSLTRSRLISTVQAGTILITLLNTVVVLLDR